MLDWITYTLWRTCGYRCQRKALQGREMRTYLHLQNSVVSEEVFELYGESSGVDTLGGELSADWGHDFLCGDVDEQQTYSMLQGWWLKD